MKGKIMILVTVAFMLAMNASAWAANTSTYAGEAERAYDLLQPTEREEHISDQLTVGGPEQTAQAGRFKGSVTVSILTKGRIRPGKLVTLEATVKGMKGIAYSLRWEHHDGISWQMVPGENGSRYAFVATQGNIGGQWRAVLVAETGNEAYAYPVNLRSRLARTRVSDSEPEAPVEVEQEVELEADTEVELEADPEVELEADPEVELEIDPEADPEVELEFDPEADPEVDPETVPEDGMIEAEAPTEQDEDQAPAEPDLVPGRITTEEDNGGVNVRNTPDLDGEVIAQIIDGTQVTVIGREGDWVLVEFDGIRGYVYARFVDTAPTLDEEAADEDQPQSAYKVSIHANKNPKSLGMGDHMVMWVELEGAADENASYQWQIFRGDGWTDIPGATGSQYAITVTADNMGCSWRAKVSVDA